jgi:hypothetical protein
MEAWALADPDAIARACGLERWPTHASPEWDSQDVEALANPKGTLREAIRSLLSRTRQRRLPPLGDTLERIGTEIDLGRLMRTRSFSEFSDNLQNSFQAGGYLGF